LGERPETVDIDLGVDLSRIGRAVAEHFANLGHGGSTAKHVGRQAVSKQMGLHLGTNAARSTARFTIVLSDEAK
jgi:hypothetical protein